MIQLKIKEMLKKQKKTKYWLIKNMQSGYQAMNKMINNETSSIKFETLDKMCDLLNCEVSDLVVRKKRKEKKERCIIFFYQHKRKTEKPVKNILLKIPLTNSRILIY